MMVMNSPDLIALSEPVLMRWLTSSDRRPNLLVVCAEADVEAAVERLKEFCIDPCHSCTVPGPLQLPSNKTGTLLLSDASAMSLDQQIALFDWLNAGGGKLQIISVSSVPLYALIERGLFLEGLYYRLNAVCLAATRQGSRRRSWSIEKDVRSWKLRMSRIFD
jgi:hypothetical protein